MPLFNFELNRELGSDIVPRKKFLHLLDLKLLRYSVLNKSETIVHLLIIFSKIVYYVAFGLYMPFTVRPNSLAT